MLTKQNNKLNVDFETGTPVVTIKQPIIPPEPLLHEWADKYDKVLSDYDLVVGINYPWYSVHGDVAKVIDSPIHVKNDEDEFSIDNNVMTSEVPNVMPNQNSEESKEQFESASSASSSWDASNQGIGDVVFDTHGAEPVVTKTSYGTMPGLFVLGAGSQTTSHLADALSKSSLSDSSSSQDTTYADLIAALDAKKDVSYNASSEAISYDSYETSEIVESKQPGSVKPSKPKSVLPTQNPEYLRYVELSDKQLADLKHDHDEAITYAQELALKIVSKDKATFKSLSDFSENKVYEWQSHQVLQDHLDDLEILTDKVETAKKKYKESRAKAMDMYHKIVDDCEIEYQEFYNSVLKKRKALLNSSIEKSLE